MTGKKQQNKKVQQQWTTTTPKCHLFASFKPW